MRTLTERERPSTQSPGAGNPRRLPWQCLRRRPPTVIVFSTQPKEYIMDKTPELELVDLGDAKEVTMGTNSVQNTEDHPVISRRLEG